MNVFSSMGEAVTSSLVDLWVRVAAYIPSIIAALVVLIIGIIIARAIAAVVQKVIEAVKIDDLVRKIDLVQKMEHAGTKITVSAIIAWLVKWFLYIAILIAVSEILQLGQFTAFLNDIALYIPNVIIAALILVVGLVVGYFVDDLIVKVLKGTRARMAPLVGTVAKWSIVVFSVFAALIQLNVAVALINTLFTAIVVTLSLAAGLAFGLGGKDAARDAIERVRRDINR